MKCRIHSLLKSNQISDVQHYSQGVIIGVILASAQGVLGVILARDKGVIIGVILASAQGVLGVILARDKGVIIGVILARAMGFILTTASL